MKATHTWKLGEVCKGGIITVNVNGKQITCILKDWDYSKGSRRSSDQSNAKAIQQETYSSDQRDVYRLLLDLLCNWTTSYYADKICEWIITKSDVKKSLFW